MLLHLLQQGLQRQTLLVRMLSSCWALCMSKKKSIEFPLLRAPAADRQVSKIFKGREATRLPLQVGQAVEVCLGHHDTPPQPTGVAARANNR